MPNILNPIVALLNDKGYIVNEVFDCDIMNDPDKLFEYKRSYIKFGPLKDTVEKGVGKFIFNDEATESATADDMLEDYTPHAARKQFIGMLKSFNDHSSNACRIYLDDIEMHWYFESEVATDEEGHLYYTLFINCANGDPDSKLRFNIYRYEEEYKYILSHIYDAILDLRENLRFTKMY